MLYGLNSFLHDLFTRFFLIVLLFPWFVLLKKVKTTTDFLYFLKYISYALLILVIFFAINDDSTWWIWKGVVLYVILLISFILFFVTNILISFVEKDFFKFILFLLALFLLFFYWWSSSTYIFIIIIVIYDILTLNKVKDFFISIKWLLLNNKTKSKKYNVKDRKWLFLDNKNKSKKYYIKDKIKDIDISNIKNIQLKYNNWPKYNVNYKELIKIIIYIINNTWKTKFKALELQDFYNFTLKTYKLEEKKYKKNLSKLKEFVDNWWEIVVEYKKIW